MRKTKNKLSKINMNQMLLFEEPIENKLRKEIQDLKECIDRIRKGQFAKLGELKKMYDDLHNDMKIIKEGICRQDMQKKKNKCEIIELVLY